MAITPCDILSCQNCDRIFHSRVVYKVHTKNVIILPYGNPVTCICDGTSLLQQRNLAPNNLKTRSEKEVTLSLSQCIKNLLNLDSRKCIVGKTTPNEQKSYPNQNVNVQVGNSIVQTIQFRDSITRLDRSQSTTKLQWKIKQIPSQQLCQI